MIGTPRTPAFLSSLALDASSVRLASFAVAPGSPRPRGGQAAPPEPAPQSGPTSEQMEALRREAMQRVAHAVEVLRLQAERLGEQARSDALEIGFRVAKRILESELSSSPEALFSLVRAALKRAGESRKVIVRVHPQDAKILAPAMAADGLGVASATVEVAADSSLSPGDCVVDTDFGKVDGRLQTRLDELKQAVTAAVQEGAA